MLPAVILLMTAFTKQLPRRFYAADFPLSENFTLIDFLRKFISSALPCLHNIF